MPVLSNTHHELFAQGLARGLKATKAYVTAGYAEKGARQNANHARSIRPRRLGVPEVCVRYFSCDSVSIARRIMRVLSCDAFAAPIPATKTAAITAANPNGKAV